MPLPYPTQRGKADEKTIVLDTNVLLSDPLAIYAFEDNNVVIPSVVLEELDSKKNFLMN